MSELVETICSARVIDLSQAFDGRMAARPLHAPFRMGSILRHGDLPSRDNVTATLELISMSTHTGTHIDALSHIAHEGVLHGDVEADSAMAGGVFSQHGVETIAPLVYRAVLLDVASLLGVDRTLDTHRVTAGELDAACKRQRVQVAPGSAVLIRLGWGASDHYMTDAYLGGSGPLPGVDTSAARWLVDRGVRLTGTDTIAYEALAAGDPDRPVHRILLKEAGIYIVENLALEDLASADVPEFALVIAPLRLVGASGSPVRPLALLGA